VTRAALSVALLLLGPAFAQATPGTDVVRARFGGVHVPFIANEGQVDPRVAYYAPTFAGTLFVTRQGEVVHSLPRPPETKRPASSTGWSLAETFVRGRPRPAGTDSGATGVSVFRGADPARWRTGLPTYGQVSLGEVWPGVEVSLAARGGSVEKLFTVKPGARVDRIRVRVRGARTLALDPQGALIVETGLGPVTFSAPAAYQPQAGERRPVAVTYQRRGREYGFTVGAYDRRLPLVIDPLLQSTYLGTDEEDFAQAVAVHPSTGDVYVAGRTRCTDFPGTLGGAQPAAGSGNGDGFVARLNSTLTALTQATYLGGSGGGDTPRALAIDPTTGDVYVTGSTDSNDFPGVMGGAQTTNVGNIAGFVTRLNSTLTVLVQSTYLGGTLAAFPNALAIHPATGDVYVGGITFSTDLPGTTGGAQPASGGGDIEGFVARLNSTLTSLLQATYLGGSGDDLPNAIAINATTGDVYVTGLTDSSDFPGVAGGAQPDNAGNGDAWVARLNSALTAVIQATYLGGGSGEDEGYAITLDPTSGDVYVAGRTGSADFPGTASGAQSMFGGVQDAFAARLNGALTALFQATYLGGTGDDFAQAIAINATTGDVYLAGRTASTDFPNITGGAQPAFGGGVLDAFVARLSLAANGPDLTPAKAHIGSFFYQGQEAAGYTIAVRNVGRAATSGLVTVTDTLPAGLTATALTGTGWACVLATLTCTRSDALATGSTYPSIALTVTVATNASSPLINGVAVSGGGDVNPSNDAASVSTRVIPTFTDVPVGVGFFAWIEALFAAGITGGCSASPPMYCPAATVNRAQMAVFLLRGIHGAAYQPPAAIGMFTDVPTSGPNAHPLAAWIEELAREGITTGCGPSTYCPDNAVTRGQMAVFLLRAKHGAAYQPPAATGMFADVPISGPSAHPFAKWIEELAREGITGGCSTSPAQYCPDAPATRGQMAVFLVRTFNLPM
jgi:uncharacterized repeat protein (TIGR01451 family)